MALVDRRVVPCLYRETMLGGRDYPFSCHCEDPSSANRTIIRINVYMRAALRTRDSTRKLVPLLDDTHGINFKRPFSTESNKEENGRKEFIGRKTSFQIWSYNKSYFSYIRVAIERNILKNLFFFFFFQKIVACLRDRIALLYDQPILPLLTRPSFALRNVLLKHDTHCSSFSYSWSKKHCHVSFHFVSLFSVLLNLRRWIRYAFFFFLWLTR